MPCESWAYHDRTCLDICPFCESCIKDCRCSHCGSCVTYCPCHDDPDDTGWLCSDRECAIGRDNRRVRVHPCELCDRIHCVPCKCGIWCSFVCACPHCSDCLYSCDCHEMKDGRKLCSEQSCPVGGVTLDKCLACATHRRRCPARECKRCDFPCACTTCDKCKYSACEYKHYHPGRNETHIMCNDHSCRKRYRLWSATG
ncbi:hypothetical protein CC85DRAFT_287450 [Cutaneotrichosporon oleaginosum]|uniref:Uncharacterized protein n=1 Tax=Cutaneotrichosporon oleaginosum TaxID=879819 RepID=A0A0J1AYS8_9TREE|nr:uncharacterized protein CC85DRAFT_287450 [Cutaneotrichosporon oleaginosum]KLT40474.1 hypothetical protein CC85DRAFT_287450 [Cutaneotrichosporon oleaginosum]TXT15335.1 hypothetical protein COLE_01528 [Cutaneotrichosporon oleaginosum]